MNGGGQNDRPLSPEAQALWRAVALELLRLGDAWLAFGGAMALHGMGPLPEREIVAAGRRGRRPRPVAGRELRFVTCRTAAAPGIVERLVAPGLPLRVTDPERTLVDGLRRPELCGGFPTVAALLLRAEEGAGASPAGLRAPAPDPDRLADCALQLGLRSVAQRLGFLLELRRPLSAAAVARLQAVVGSSWTSLDPGRPRSGPHLARWRLIVNVAPEDLAALSGRAPELWRAVAAPGPSSPTSSASAATPASPAPRGLPGMTGRASLALSQVCCRHDVWRVAVLDGVLADIAGPQRRAPWLPEGSEVAAYPGEPVTLLVDYHYRRDPTLVQLARLEQELSAALGRTVVLRTMVDLLARLARGTWRLSGQIYYRKHGGHRSSAAARKRTRRARAASRAESAD